MVTIRIPAGAKDGCKLRIAGDLVIQLQVNQSEPLRWSLDNVALLTGLLLGLGGGVTWLLSSFNNPVELAILTTGMALFAFGLMVIPVLRWDAKTSIRRKTPRSKMPGFISAAAGGLLAAVIFLLVVSLFVTHSDAFRYQYGTPVTVAVSNDCSYMATTNHVATSGVTCRGSTWHAAGRAVTGSLYLTWQEYQPGSGASYIVKAHAMGGSAVTAGYQRSPNITLLGRVPYRYVLLPLALILLLGPVFRTAARYIVPGTTGPGSTGP